MIAPAYEFDIRRATDAATLHTLAADIRQDEDLSEVEKNELQTKISVRFCELNHAANRW